MNSKRIIVEILAIGLIIASLGGCLSSGTDSASEPTPPPTTPPPPPPPPPPGGNNAPSISGQPAGSVTVGANYSFTPTASDPDGDSLTFSVQNLPNWAVFDAASGTVSGTPLLGNIGTYANIGISVSDGSSSASLPQFSISVDQVSLGSVTLNWSAPTQNTDGSPLTDLAGYNIYFGSSSGSYPNSIYVNNAGITTYVVDNLSPNTYYFVATSQNTQGVESAYSNEAVKTVN